MNTKAKKIKSKTLDITNLATEAALNTKPTEIQNKIFDNTGIIITPEFNRLTKTNFDGRMKQETYILKIYL